MRHDVVAGVQQARHHARAHAAQADEADLALPQGGKMRGGLARALLWRVIFVLVAAA